MSSSVPIKQQKQEKEENKAPPALIKNTPRDGPATSFEADPIMRQMVLGTSDEPSFGLVLVAGWPPSPPLCDMYEKFVRLAKDCFSPTDHAQGSVYFYPSSCLHVTVASLHSIQQHTTDKAQQIQLTEVWTKVVKRAAARPEWPTQNLQLLMDRAQIGRRAGILLWKETTGGLKQMRNCLAQEAALAQLPISIPPICHSTFLRFPHIPTTDGTKVQEQFQTKVVNQLEEIFSSPLLIKDVKLVCERVPYMHIPNNAECVLSTFGLGV